MRWSNRHDDARHAQIPGESCGVHRSATSKGYHRKFTRIASLAHRNQLEKVDHVGIGDTDNTESCLLNADSKRFCYGLHRCAGALYIKLDLAAEEIVRIDAANKHVRIGDCWLCSATTIGGRTRLGAGAARSNFERSGRIDPCDAASTSANLNDIHHRHFDRIASSRRRALNKIIAGHAYRAPFNQRRFRRCSTDIERDDILLIQQLSNHRRANDTAYRPGLNQVDRRAAGKLKAGNTSVRLHRVTHISLNPGLVETPRERFQVAARYWLDIRIQYNSAGPVELAPFIRKFMRCGYIDIRPCFAYNFSGALLVGGIGVRVQETDGNGLCTLAPGLGDCRAHIIFDERLQHLALVIHAFGYFEAQPARYKGPGLGK